jgi:hypothetical protein
MLASRNIINHKDHKGRKGRPLAVKLQAAPGFNFNAYAYRDHDESVYVTLINKSYGEEAQSASVSLRLLPGAGPGTWQRMDLVQENQDVAAKTGLKLGGASIDAQGTWSGRWERIKDGDSGNLTVPVAPASVSILHFTPVK